MARSEVISQIVRWPSKIILLDKTGALEPKRSQ